ncbi:MAG: DUF1700 domain-containing protein [Anaerostipes sp.]
MSKEQFLQELERQLKVLGESECERYLDYYDEMIEDYKENGFFEEEAILKIGTPKEVIQVILGEQDTIELKVRSTGSKVINILLLILGFPLWGALLLALICCIASVYIVIMSVPFTTGVVAVSSLFVSVVGIVGTPFVIANGSLAMGITQLGIGICCIGIAILSAIVTWIILKVVVKLTIRFTKWLISLFRRKVVRV